MGSTSLPYYAQPSELPCPRTIKEQIHSSQYLLLECGKRRKVAVVGLYFIVKYGCDVKLIEGENLLLMSRLEDSSVQAPKIYAIYEDLADKIKYIVMERINGITLCSVWDSLQYPQKEVICLELRRIMDVLRKIASSGGCCSVNRRRLENDMFWRIDDNKTVIKSRNTKSCRSSWSAQRTAQRTFDTEDEVNLAMIMNYLYHNGSPGKAVFYERTLPRVFCDNPPTFSHGDLQRKNIMISHVPKLDDSGKVIEDDLKIVLIDWETAGWYPSYWEYSRGMMGCRYFKDDWRYWFGVILDEYLTEWPWIQMMFLELYS
jgi:hypothetical protein